MEDLKKIYVVHMAITDPIGDFTMDMLDNDSDMTDVFSNSDTPSDNVEKVVNEEDLFNETVEDGEHPEGVDSNGDIIDKGEDTNNSAKESSTPLSSILSALSIIIAISPSKSFFSKFRSSLARASLIGSVSVK